MSNSRIDELRQGLRKEGLDGLLVSTPENIRYLSGFVGLSPEEREAWLFITPTSTFLVTDSRYAEQTKKLKTGFEVLIIQSGETFPKLFSKIIRKTRAKKVGFESKNLKFAEYEKLKPEENTSEVAEWTPRRWEKIEFLPTEGLVENLRQEKNVDELSKIQRAVSIVDSAFEHILNFLKPGLTEKEIALELECIMRRNGAEGTAFETIVASGPGSAEPHYLTGDKKLLKGEILLMDFGAKFQGYCSDMTRCIILGKPTEDQKRTYRTVLEAQKRAIAQIKPGMEGTEADSIARESIKKKNLPPYAHELGHGVGLAIHETPYLKPQSSDTLKPGMVFSVEPGIYLPGWGGIRIEDLVVLKEDGVELLTKSPKRLISL